MDSYKSDNKIKDNKSSQLKILKSIIALLFLVIVAGYFYLFNNSNSRILNNNPYPFIDLSRNFIPQEDFIVNIQPLRESVNQLVKDEGVEDSVSIYFEVLNTGANISINQQKKIFPASLTKLPLAIAVTKKIDDSIWDWNYKLTINQEDLDQNSGYLYKRGAGTEITIEELLKELLINSDNTAYKVLLRNIETANLTKMVTSLGLEDLFEEDGKMSAKEYTRFFRSLYTSSYLSRASSQKLLTFLTESKFDEYLQSGMPKSVPFAHKIGENYLYNSYSDIGIVYLNHRPYIISVMYESKDGEKDKVKVTAFMKKLSEQIYEYVKNQ